MLSVSIQPIATGVIIGSKTAFVRTEIIFFLWCLETIVVVVVVDGFDCFRTKAVVAERREHEHADGFIARATRGALILLPCCASAARGATGETTLFTLEARREFF